MDDDALSSEWPVNAALLVDIPPEVSSLADEVDVQVARFHTSTIQEGKQRLP